MDPQEATIAALKRELAALRNENMHLREQTLAGAAAAGVLAALGAAHPHPLCGFGSSLLAISVRVGIWNEMSCMRIGWPG